MKHYVPGTRVSLLSRPAKMDCLSWSLPAGGAACPSKNGTICADCYACKGRYVMPNVKAAQQARWEWTRECMRTVEGMARWVRVMADAIRDENRTGYFRIHDSGDMFSHRYCAAWIAVATMLPNIKFWCPTRRWQVPVGRRTENAFKILGDEQPITAALQQLHALPNVSVTPSALNYDDPAPFAWKLGPGVTSVTPHLRELPSNHSSCPASLRHSSCDAEGCRACWDKERTHFVAYRQH